MRLCPDEACVNEANFAKTFEFFQTESEQFTTFKLRCDPVVWRLEVPFAIATKVDGAAFWNSFSDVYFVSDAIDAHISWVWFYGCTALTAKNELLRRRADSDCKIRRLR